MNHRVSAEIDGEFVVFVLGMHINRPFHVRAWLPVVLAMPRMVRELIKRPELGMLRAYGGWMFGGPTYIQYWRSYDQLVAYARSAEAEHLPAWRAFNRAARSTDAVGVFHETYRVSDGNWETVYSHMPTIGLRAASSGRRIAAASTSAVRMGDLDQHAAPVGAAP